MIRKFIQNDAYMLANKHSIFSIPFWHIFINKDYIISLDILHINISYDFSCSLHTDIMYDFFLSVI